MTGSGLKLIRTPSVNGAYASSKIAATHICIGISQISISTTCMSVASLAMPATDLPN